MKDNLRIVFANYVIRNIFLEQSIIMTVEYPGHEEIFWYAIYITNTIYMGLLYVFIVFVVVTTFLLMYSPLFVTSVVQFWTGILIHISNII